ncbi:MAG TPA: hypothetical protein VF334_01810 [Polyangia bacterium]
MRRCRFVVAAAAILLIAAAPARADELADAKALRRDGIGVTVAGGALDLVGAGLLIGAVAAPPNCAFVIGAPEEGMCAFGGTTKYDTTVRGLILAGIVVSVVGDASLLAGGIEWGVGAHRIRKLQRATAAR